MSNKVVNNIESIHRAKELIGLGNLNEAILTFLEITKNDGDFHNQVISLLQLKHLHII
jgi:hypothetical protein